MSTPGLSLVGFMDDQQHALRHLTTQCVPTPKNKSETALIADWQAAQAQLGPPVQNAGQCSCTPIADTDPHIQQVRQQNPALAAASFHLVEIDPLLAWQFTVDLARSKDHCGSLSNPPTMDELNHLCLPLGPPTDEMHVSQQPRSIVIRSRSLNLRLMHEGPMPVPHAYGVGIQFGWALPFVHVVRFQGRCFLFNGFHRAFGARLAGAKYVPCFFRDVASYDEAGVKADGTTFPAALFDGPNPPTVAHFTQTRAYPVELRAASRILQISWSDHILFDE